jgi:hypothetical protein
MTFFADASGAVTAMREYVWPTMKVLASLAAIARANLVYVTDMTMSFRLIFLKSLV